MTGNTNQKQADAEKDVNTAVDTNLEVDDGSKLFADEETDSEEAEEDAEDTDKEEDSDDEDDSDDSEEEEDEEDDSDEETEDETKEADKKAGKKAGSVKSMLKVTYNGEEKEIDPMGDEAKSFIQKGMNYDRVSEKLSGYEKVLTEYGKMNGSKNAGDALQSLVEAVNAATVETELKELKAKFPNSDEDALKELAQERAKAKALKIKKATEEEEELKQLQELTAAYPKYSKVEDLPKEVQKAINGGKSPLLAMKDNEIAELNKKVEQLTKEKDAAIRDKKNRDRTTGSAKGTTAKSKTDPFLKGLNG